MSSENFSEVRAGLACFPEKEIKIPVNHMLWHKNWNTPHASPTHVFLLHLSPLFFRAQVFLRLLFLCFFFWIGFFVFFLEMASFFLFPFFFTLFLFSFSKSWHYHTVPAAGMQENGDGIPSLAHSIDVCTLSCLWSQGREMSILRAEMPWGVLDYALCWDETHLDSLMSKSTRDMATFN